MIDWPLLASIVFAVGMTFALALQIRAKTIAFKRAGLMWALFVLGDVLHYLGRGRSASLLMASLVLLLACFQMWSRNVLDRIAEKQKTGG
jgi:hypothetical protein